MDKAAVVAGLDAFVAAAVAFAECSLRGLGLGSEGADPLRDQADACLDGLGDSARVEAMLAAWRVQLAAAYAAKATALAGPAASPQENTAQEMDVVSEVACALTVSERSASALLAQSHELTTALPLTLAALQEGDLSWQHQILGLPSDQGLCAALPEEIRPGELPPECPLPEGLFRDGLFPDGAGPKDPMSGWGSAVVPAGLTGPGFGSG